MIEKAPIIPDLKYRGIGKPELMDTSTCYNNIEWHRDADHQYYLKKFVYWLNKNYWTGLGTYNIPLADVTALLKDSGEFEDAKR